MFHTLLLDEVRAPIDDSTKDERVDTFQRASSFEFGL